ncbi:peptidoglycan recognition protein family protein [Melittangium boletus]|nr:peptidoglycan recognition family protein [Melittangium boletus]
MGKVLNWSAALRDKPYKNPRGTYQGILADLPRDTRVTVVGKEQGWLRIDVTRDGRLLKGYVSQELIGYVSPKLAVAPRKLAQYQAALAANDWLDAATLLNGFKDTDVLVLLKKLSAPQLAQMKQGAIRGLLIPLRVAQPIELLNPFASIVGSKLARAHQQLEALRVQFQATVISREQWGARPPDKSKGWDEYPKNASLPLYRIVVHHTAEPQHQTARQLQDKEMDDAGYSDMPYHFVITGNGKIHEGREMDVVGAHAGLIKGNKDIKKDPDYGSIGIVLTGDFESRIQNGWSPDTPTNAQLTSLQLLVNHLVQQYQLDPANILKHRDVERGGKVTVCPGGKLASHVDLIRTRTQKTVKELAEAEAQLAAAEQEAAKLK